MILSSKRSFCYQSYRRLVDEMIEAGRRCKTGHIKKEKSGRPRRLTQDYRTNSIGLMIGIWTGMNFEQAVFCHDIKIVE